jgi:hypothetical protein
VDLEVARYPECGMSRITKPLIKWGHLPNSDRILIFKTALLLASIRLALGLLPLSTIRRFLMRKAKASSAKIDHSHQGLEKEIWAIESVGKYILGDGPCLTQALAAQQVLTRLNKPSDLCIGVAKDEQGKLVAHAWVESEGAVIIGGSEDSLQRYTKLPTLEGKLF